MAARPITISCPACARTVRPRLDDVESTDEATDTLFGQPVTCRECDAEFEVLFYE